MNTDHELGLLASYFLNACEAWKKNPRWMRGLAEAVDLYSGDFGSEYACPAPQKTVAASSKGAQKGAKNRSEKLTDADIRKLEDHLTGVVKSFEGKPAGENYAFLDKLLAHLEFDSTDRKIAELLLLSASGAFECFFEDVYSALTTAPTSLEIISAFLGEDKQTIQPHLKFAAPLLNSGIIYQVARDWENLPVTDRMTYFLHDKILASIDNGEFDVAAGVERLLGKPVPPATEWDDFAHIKAEAEYAARIVRGALKENAQGVNILVYGDTGVGKTEFCRTLAAHLSVPLYPVGEKMEAEEDDFGDNNHKPDPSSPAARLADKRLVENMLGRRKTKALTMFDEMEDVLGSDEMRSSLGRISSLQMSKSATNNLLTQNDIPCLWTTNNIDRFDPAMLRRFSFAVELKTPNAAVRQRVILRTLQRYGKELTSNEARTLADNNAVPPAFFNKTIESASLAANGGEGNFHSDLQMGLRSIGRLVGGQQETKAPRPVENYDLGLVNANQDLGELTAKIVDGGHLNFSICAYGVSGAGKSEYLVHLAQKVGIEPMLVPYSDVGSAYVSESEQNIRRKFEEAADERKFLIFDEADSMLADRRGAKNSWERTLVNEMLTRMERHPMPFGCTTNLMNEIDQASLRRFVFKIRFDGLTRAQSQKAFQVYFGHELPQNISLPPTVAPGDFSTVLRQAKILNTLNDTNWLVKALVRECESKGPAPSREIGFLATLHSRSLSPE